ncbi:MAG: transcriptional repressor [Thermoguttaceae bacterium]|jgi:Fur family ferric uptake transcriptional regulator
MASDTFYRNTRQRRIILEELRGVKSHPTAVEIFERVRRRLPKISLGTVYRNLDLLTRLGMIQKLEWSAGEARFDGAVAAHDHLRCLGCGRVDDAGRVSVDLSSVQPKGTVPFSSDENRDRPRDFGGYEVRGYRLELLGLCPRCRQQRRTTGDGQRTFDGTQRPTFPSNHSV